jgi:predicted metal-dependent hydrolase
MTLPDTAALRLGEREIVLHLRRSVRARRVALRIDPSSFVIELVLPARASLGEALRFAARQTDWIERRLSKLPARNELADGAILPLLGVPHRLRHLPQTRRKVERVLLADGSAELVIGSGEAAHLPRRVKDWLRHEALCAIAPLAQDKAARIDKRIARLSFRDSRTRWGSCSASGALSFCWRLVMTPPQIVDYLAAHEVAHLAELNHGERFWQRCAELAEYDIAASRRWLRRNGEAILAIG